jgi:sigma-B regulation protein RsbU (phosphoserine phosphatase)
MLDLKSGLMEYCNAGHNPPVLVNNNSGFLPVLPNLAIGLVPDFEFERQVFQFDIGTTLLLYTDGLTEAENKDEKLYGNDQLLQLLSQNQFGSAREMIDGIANDVHGHVLDAEQSDDLAMVAIVYKGTPATSCYTQKLILLNEVSQIPVLQSFVQNLGEDLQLNASQIMNLNLALEEAVSNIIFYAYPNEQGKTIQLSVVQQDLLLLFTVTDQGLPFDPTQSKDPQLNLTAEQRPLGGLGIYLIKQIMDEVGYSRNGENNVLTMKMNLINNHQ